MSSRPSLWIDRDDGRDPDSGPFSAARWRRQSERPGEGGPVPEPPAPPPRRRRVLPFVTLAIALAALAVGVGAIVLDRQGTSDTAPLAAPGGRLAPTEVGRVIDSAGPGVVSVQAGPARGTGFVVRENGTIVTNAHVVGDAQTTQVRFGDNGELVEAEVLGFDRSSDIAVLRVDPGQVGSLRALPLADSDQVEVGAAVVAIGHPLGLERTATTGIVSGTEREIRAPDGFQIDEVIQTDAAINPGNSGGPLLDARGRVVGVNTQIATGGAGGGNIGIGFAVPSNTVRDVLPRLSRGQTIRRAYLGVTTSTDPNGARIEEVTPGSPAAGAGLNVGDVIRRIEGRPVRDPDDVAQAISDLEPGDEVDLTVSRNGIERAESLELGTRP